MNQIVQRGKQLPETIKEKVLYVLFGQDKLNQYRAQLSALAKAGITGEQYQQLQLEAQETAENLLTYGVDVGNYMATEIPKASGGDRRSEDFKTVDDHDFENKVAESVDDHDFRNPTKASVIRAMGFTENQARDLQKIARHPEAVQDAIEKARDEERIVTKQDVFREIAEAEHKPHVSHNSGNNEWYTPIEIIETARLTMGSIDLDPASSEIANETVQANAYYTIDDNGLEQDWFGNVWMNPPYASDLIGLFTDKLIDELPNIDQAIVLVNNATETEWFCKMARHVDAICFPRTRVKFKTPDGKTGAPLQGQAILYFGDDAQGFCERFEAFGWCVVPA